MKILCTWCASPEAGAYVASRRWEELRSRPTLFTWHRGNSVWRATIEPFGDVIVKESRLDSSFSLFERIGRELRFRLFDVDMRDARAALKAESLGVATYHPLAVWRTREGLSTSCYIMYTYVDGRPLSDICGGGVFDESVRPEVRRHLRELGGIARLLHDGGLRHRDLVPQNVIIRPDGTLALIDFASGYPVKCRWRRFRMARDFALLRRLAHILDADILAAFCEGYCGSGHGSDFEHALMLMLYWKYNGHRRKGRISALRFQSAFVRTLFMD
ncbi:MAG: hypothetical protein IJT64_03005 [Kiritimatiellae bacterium]|nr:hypothetical protein [Kiritimatiellia bacterium]